MDEAIVETGAVAATEMAASALAGRAHCANCGESLKGRFCAVCGQAADNHRRSVAHLLGDFFKDIASFDSRILRTAYALLLRPGELPLAFREGRTQRYVPPVRLYLFVSLIFFVVLSLTHVALVQFVIRAWPAQTIIHQGKTYLIERDGSRIPVSAAKYKDSKDHFTFSSEIVLFQREGAVHAQVTPQAMKHLTQSLSQRTEQSKSQDAGVVTRTILATMTKLANDPAALNGALTAWIPRALFLLLPLFALIMAAFYWRQRKSLFFVDHLVFSLNFHSFGFVLQLVAAGLAQFMAGEIALYVMAAAMAVYLLIAMKRFYGQNWFWTSLKGVSAGFLYVFFCVLPALGGVIAAAAFWG